MRLRPTLATSPEGMTLNVNAGPRCPKVHPADELAPVCSLKRHKPPRLAAEQQHHNNDDEKKADPAANIEATGQNR